MKKSALINEIKTLKTDIERDKPIEYQIVLDEVLKMLGGKDMMIPDCRTDKVYNTKNLNPDDAMFTKGYDWCTGVIDNFFDNLDVFYSKDDYIMHELNTQAQRLYEGDKTYLDLLKENMLKWIEMERNDSIVSMIDGYGAEDDED